MLEAELKRKLFLLPNDIKSCAIQNIMDFFMTPTDKLIHTLALKQFIMIKYPKKTREEQRDFMNAAENVTSEKPDPKTNFEKSQARLKALR